MKATILFKDRSAKTTTTQQIFMSKGRLYLYVDAVMKTKTPRNKRKKICVGELLISRAHMQMIFSSFYFFRRLNTLFVLSLT